MHGTHNMAIQGLQNQGLAKTKVAWTSNLWFIRNHQTSNLNPGTEAGLQLTDCPVNRFSLCPYWQIRHWAGALPPLLARQWDDWQDQLGKWTSLPHLNGRYPDFEPQAASHPSSFNASQLGMSLLSHSHSCQSAGKGRGTAQLGWSGLEFVIHGMPTYFEVSTILHSGTQVTMHRLSRAL